MQYLELDQVLPMIQSDLIYSFYLEIYSLIRNSSCYLQYMVILIYKPITFCQFVKLIKLMSVFLFLFLFEGLQFILANIFMLILLMEFRLDRLKIVCLRRLIRLFIWTFSRALPWLEQDYLLKLRVLEIVTKILIYS